MKHLKLEVLTTAWGKFLRVASQTHRLHGFGEGGSSSFIHSGFYLASGNYPDIIHSEPALYVCGNDSTQDKNILIVPSEEWLEKCRAAVRAYNQHFDGKAETKDSIPNIEIIE